MGPVYHKEKEYPPEPYAFQYGVADDYSQTHFSAGETSDGNVVSGSYSVQLPDGRIQHVKYTADHYNGYVAEVTYEGTPHYPEEKPYHPPAPSYAPKPAPYHPSPKPAPYHPPKPVYHKPEPVYHKPEPVYHKPEPVYKPAPYHPPAPVYKPAPTYHVPEPVYHSPPSYSG